MKYFFIVCDKIIQHLINLINALTKFLRAVFWICIIYFVTTWHPINNIQNKLSVHKTLITGKVKNIKLGIVQHFLKKTNPLTIKK